MLVGQGDQEGQWGPRGLTVWDLTTLLALHQAKITLASLTKKGERGVSSVPFPFWFPFQLHCQLVSSGIGWGIISKYFDMVCYLKQETYSGPISFEVQWNDIWTDNNQSFEMPF